MPLCSFSLIFLLFSLFSLFSSVSSEEFSRLELLKSPEYRQGGWILWNDEDSALSEFSRFQSSKGFSVGRPVTMKIREFLINDRIMGKKIKEIEERAKTSPTAIPKHLDYDEDYSDENVHGLVERSTVHKISRCSLLDLAAMKNFPRLTKKLIESGADVKRSDCILKSLLQLNSLNSLHMAAIFSPAPAAAATADASDAVAGQETFQQEMNNCLETVEILIAAGVPLDDLASPGSESLLTIVADRGNFPLFRLLAEKMRPKHYENQSWWKISENQPLDNPDESSSSSVPLVYRIHSDGSRSAIAPQSRDPSELADGETIFPSRPLNAYKITQSRIQYPNHPENPLVSIPISFLFYYSHLHRSFHYSIMRNSMDIIQYFIENRVIMKLNVNYRSHGGRGDTALHGACLVDSAPIMRLLLSAGADFRLPSGSDGETPEQLCKRIEAKQALKVLHDFIQSSAVEESLDKRGPKESVEKIHTEL